jgi:hypothetical protein
MEFALVMNRTSTNVSCPFSDRSAIPNGIGKWYRLAVGFLTISGCLSMPTVECFKEEVIEPAASRFVEIWVIVVP